MIYISVVFVICNSNSYYCYYNSGISIICIIFALIKRDHTLDFCSSENLSFILEKFFFVLSRIYKIKITRDQWYTGLHVPVCFWFHIDWKKYVSQDFLLCSAKNDITLHVLWWWYSQKFMIKCLKWFINFKTQNKFCLCLQEKLRIYQSQSIKRL